MRNKFTALALIVIAIISAGHESPEDNNEQTTEAAGEVVSSETIIYESEEVSVTEVSETGSGDESENDEEEGVPNA